MRASADIYTDFSHLAKLKRDSRQSSHTALKEVAKQFEALFLQMVLKQMRQASPGDPIFDSDQSNFYREMHDQQLALHLSQQGSVGIAEMIVRQLDTPGGSHPRGRSLDDYSRTRLTVTPPRRPERPEETPEKAPASPSQSASPAKPTARPPLPNRFDSPQQFLQTLLPLAKKAASSIGVDPRMLLAQAALETGWGQKIIQHPDGRSSHNLFNIKAGRHWEAGRVAVDSLEHLDGVAVRKRADFRAYDDYAQSFEDYVALLQKPRYAEALRHSRDPEKYIRSLQQAGYATDPNYADKILAIYHRQTLASLAR